MISYPCKNCEKRHSACHDTCEKYLEIKKLNKEARDKKQEELLILYGGKREARKRMRTLRKTNSVGDKEYFD